MRASPLSFSHRIEVSAIQVDRPFVEFQGRNGASLSLAGPVMTAAGCTGDCVRFARSGWLDGIGAAVTHSLTVHSRRGWPQPRVVEASAGVLYASGLPNPGLNATLRSTAAAWSTLAVPVIVSVAGESLDELVTLATELESVPGVAALELNLAWLGDGCEDPSNVESVVSEVTAATSLPVIAKLSPASSIVEAATSAEYAGAVAVTVAQGWPARHFDDATGHDLFEGRPAALAGPAITPLTLGLVERVAAAIGIGVIACGGVDSGKAARQYLAAGARAVQVGSSLFRRPSLAAEIAAEFSRVPAAGSPS